jgi:CRISPR/Cas system-associated exonuclease Cas4 (RecB family)
MGLSPDRIDWAEHCVFEAKGGAGAADAVSRQGAFYALMLWAAQAHSWSAATHLISAKRDRQIEITSALVDEMVIAAETLAAIREEPQVPVVALIPFCKRCSYRALCGAS